MDDGARPEFDPEVAALESIAAALAPLDRAACQRVLKWAEDRHSRIQIADTGVAAFSRFTEALVEAARTTGDVTPLEIVRFAENVQKYERERVQAETESGGEPRV